MDWITPTLAIIQGVLWGPTGVFGIPASAGWSRNEIRWLLRNQGVQVWGLLYNVSGDTLLFMVRIKDAEFAYYLLQRAGVPVLYAPVDPVDFELQDESADPYTYAEDYLPCYPEYSDMDY